MSRKAVIVVEDEPMLRADAAVLLDAAGLDVIAVETADEALIIIAADPSFIAAVFADLCVPGEKDGVHLAEMVARQWPHIAVVVTSGQIGLETQIPNVRFLSKPWRPLDVLTAMQNAAS